MKEKLLLLLIGFFSPAFTQKVIELQSIPSPPEIKWDRPERQYFSQIWQTEVVTNVSKPTMTVHLPVPADAMPLFVVCSADDFFGFQNQSVDIFKKWNAAGKPVELHIY